MRLHELLLAALISGAPLLALAALAIARRPGADRRYGQRVDLRWVALPMLGWETIGALLGGSYWLHYLITLVPGLVLLAVAAASTHEPGHSRWISPNRISPGWIYVGALVVALASTLFSLGQLAAHPLRMADDEAVATYLRAHHQRGDTVVVAFGHPDIAVDAGVSEPYPYIWSLPARVRDSRLATLDAVLLGPSAPRWVVVDGESLATWGIDATTGQALLEQHYRPVDVEGPWWIYQRDKSVARAAAAIGH